MVRGEGFDGQDFRFNDIELITDKREYAPGEKVKLLINTNRNDSTVLLFVRPTNGVYLPPQVLRLQGQEHRGRDRRRAEGHAQLLRRGGDGGRRPGPHGDARGRRAAGKARPERGSAAVAAGVQAGPEGDGQGQADRLLRQAVRRLDGADACTTRAWSTSPAARNVPEIKEFFWKWRRHHYPQHRIEPRSHTSTTCCGTGEIGMATSASSAHSVVEEDATRSNAARPGERPGHGDSGGSGGGRAAAAGGCAAGAEPAEQGGRWRPQQRGSCEQAGQAGQDGQAASRRSRRRRADRPQELRRHRLLDGVADHRQGRPGRGRR